MRIHLENRRSVTEAQHESGSAVLAGLAALAVTLVLVGAALSTARHSFRTSFQSSRWGQAVHAAEAGAEIALTTAQKNSWTADGWSGTPGNPGAAPVTKTVNLSTGVPWTGPITSSIAVDKVSMGGAHWLRIRSTGHADLPGGAVAGIDARDSMLRKLTLRRDRKTGTTTSTPRASRMVEVLAAPKAATPFRYGFISKELFALLTGSHVDSYDSNDPSKSDFGPFGTYGVYSPSKSQANGDIGTIDALHTWNLNKAHIYGDVLTPTGDVDGEHNVHGSVIDKFTFTFPDEVAPNWTTVTQNHGVVTNVSKTITGGTQASPTRHKFTSINLTNANRAITINNPPGETKSWVEIWVTGDTIIDSKSNTGIDIAPGVTATFYFGAKVEVKGNGGGYGIRNGSKLPSRFIARAYGGSSGSIRDFIVDRADFYGVVSAPWYKVKFDMPGRDIYGSFLTWQFDVSAGTKIHYDESLGSLPHGQSTGYAVRSWMEAVR